ncbi:MAG: TMEM165/GDT1 family protein [Halanaeroarchaeum sp.]
MSWEHVFLVAFAAQLAALPGEKVQFIVAGLSTRYRPSIVVAATAAALGSWTVLEIWVGEAVKTLLPPTVLTAGTTVLFALFALWIYRTAPPDGASGGEVDRGAGARDLDVSVLGVDVPTALGGFLPIFALLAMGEFGDKTQIVTIGLAATYGAPSAIWLGEMAAIVPVSAVNAYVFHAYAPRVDRRSAHLLGSALFALFALDGVVSLAFGVSIWETVLGVLVAAIAG